MERASTSKSWFWSVFPQAECESLLGHVSFISLFASSLFDNFQLGCKLTYADRTAIPLIITVFSLSNLVCVEAGRSNRAEKNFQQGL